MSEETTQPTEINQPMPGALAAKIALAMRYTRRVPLDELNTHDNYRYPKNATILEHCGQGMAEAGLAVIPLLVHHKIDKEDKKFICQVEMDFYIVGDPGETFTARWVGYGDSYRTPAMALKVAITNCHVSFVAKLFMIGADDDPGGEALGEEKKAKSTRNSALYQTAGHRTEAGDYPKAWNSPVDAQAWLRTLGATAQEAQAAWMAAVRTCKGYDERKKGEVFAAFFAANKPAGTTDEQEQADATTAPA